MAGVAPITAVRQFFLNEGTLAANGTLETLVANSATRSPTWTDKAQTSNFLNTNPITLDSRGEATVWLDPAVTYDFILRDSLGGTIKTYEDVSGSAAPGSSSLSSEWVVTGLAPTFVSATTFTVVGDQTALYQVDRRVKATVAGGPRYGKILSSVFSSSTAVTVLWDAGSLDASLSAVDIGLVSATNTSLPGYPLVKFNAHRNGVNATGFTSGVSAKLVFTTEDYDVGNNFDTTLSRFTAPIAGVYRFTGALELVVGTGSGITLMSLSLLKNSSTTVKVAHANPLATQSSVILAGDLLLAAGDFVDLNVGINFTTAPTVNGSAATTYFSGSYMP